MSEWQDISTAPKDGTWVFLSGGTTTEDFCLHDEVIQDNKRPVVAKWTRGENMMWADGGWAVAYWHGDWREVYDGPTHWMHLPKLPRKPSLLADGTVDCPYNGQGVAPYKKQEGAE